MADEKKSEGQPAVGKSAPESIKTDPAQAQRLQTEGEKRGPTVQPAKAASFDPLTQTRTDPEGRVKVQDAAGNIIGDENDPAYRKAAAEKSAELRKQEDAAGNAPFAANAQSGTPISAEQHEHQAALRQSTAVQTSKTDSPFKARMRELEKQLKTSSDDKSRRAATNRANLQAQLDELKSLEARRFSGGNLNMPKGMLLDAPEAREANPDHHLRWVNVNQAGRADALIAQGYERVPSSEGGMQRGDLVLFRVPREQWAKGEVIKQERTARQLENTNKEARDITDKVLAELAERGYKVKKSDLLLEGE